MKNFYFGAAMVAVLVLLVACSDDDGPRNPGEVNRIVLSEDTRSVVEKNNDFSLKISSEIFKSVTEDQTIEDNKDRNVCVSPFSLYVELAMLANTDDPEISGEILKALGFDDTVPSAALQEYCSKMMRELPLVDGLVDCSISNAMWRVPELTLTEQFANSLNNNYGADLFVGDPRDLSVVFGDINKWIERKTNGMIVNYYKDVIDNNWLLVNSVYFKGEWDSPFDKSKTDERVFHSFDGTDSSVDFMNKTEDMRYIEREKYQAVTLYYGKRGFKMTLILPDEESSVDEVMSSMNTEEFYALQNRSNIYEVTLSLPKFRLESKLNITNDLVNIGLGSIFSKKFTGLFDTPVILKSMGHGVAIETDEDGTVAAVVTGEYEIISPGPAMPVTVTFDSPFAFIISEESTGSVLFTGKVVKL